MSPDFALGDYVQEVLADLADFFSEFNDNPESVFGEYARVTDIDGGLEVRHQTEPWGVRITVMVISDAEEQP